MNINNSDKNMIEVQQQQTKLTREQKEAVGLLSIGTFLEFFDFMLYVHMATYLNEIFFPKSDPSTATLLAAATFCSSYVLRPLGALLFGWIGDNIGRKSTFIITTAMMAGCCFTMATLPTYAEWGYKASICMVMCRIVQGLSSIGEIIGAGIYMTEITKPPIQYPTVAFLEVMAVLGGAVALAVAGLATSSNFNWRIAFWFGMAIAIIGGTARRVLKETPEFANAKLQLKRVLENANIDNKKLKDNLIINQKIQTKTILAYFLLDCFWSGNFYFTFFYCGNILKNSFGFTTEQVIHQNLIPVALQVISWSTLALLSYKIFPLKLLRIKLFIFLPFVLMCPFFLNSATNSSHIFFIQCFICIFSPTTTPAIPILFKSLPLFKRFTCAGLIYGISRATVYIVYSFGLIYLTESFGHYGILFITIPISIGYIFGLNHFYKQAEGDESRQQPSFSTPLVEETA